MRLSTLKTLGVDGPYNFILKSGMWTALDRWPVVTWFDIWATQFDILLIWIPAHTTGTVFFSEKIKISVIIYLFLFWAT